MRIGYTRVSDRDQTENLQIDSLKNAGCDVIFGDHGMSGNATQRKGLSYVLSLLKPGDTLVVWKLDRLGRSTVHLLLMLDEFRKKGIDFVAVTQGIDTTTPLGRMLYGQLALFAEFEREVIRERTKAGMAAAKQRGKHVGRPRKLSPEQIAWAREEFSARRKTQKALAAELGVAVSTLRRGTTAQ